MYTQQQMLDQLLIQTTELTLELKLLTKMVLGVYSETLPKEQFLTIANNFYNRLENDLREAFERLENEELLFDNSVILRYKMAALLTIHNEKLALPSMS